MAESDIVYTGPEALDIKDVPVPQSGNGDVLVAVQADGICGLDMHAFLGRDDLQVCSSDHSAYNFGGGQPASKTAGGPSAPFSKVPMGVPGLECRLPLLLSGALHGKLRPATCRSCGEPGGGEPDDLARVVSVCCAAPAQLYGLFPRKGTLQVGSDADVVLSIRQGLGHQPSLRRQARDLRVPILVIKADTLPQVERALERLLSRRDGQEPEDPPTGGSDAQDDELAGLEECRLAVEQVVMPQGRPVELLPRSERVRQMQADLVQRYRLRSDVFGQADHCRLRVFPP